MKVNDIVYIPLFASGPNYAARIVAIEGDFVYVSNLNSPFYGTLAGLALHKDQVEERIMSMHVCCFVTGCDSGKWRVYCYDGEGRELAYYMHYDNAAQADRICNDFITEKRVFDSRFWRYSYMEGCDAYS